MRPCFQNHVGGCSAKRKREWAPETEGNSFTFQHTLFPIVALDDWAPWSLGSLVHMEKHCKVAEGTMERHVYEPWAMVQMPSG